MTEPASGDRQAGYRYGLVLLLALALVVFEVVAPGTAASRAVIIALESAALLVVVATSRLRGEVRRARAVAVGGGAVLLIVGAATGVMGVGVTFMVIVLLTALLPLSLVQGLLRLVRERGVTVQAVAGALAVYLFVGLLFAAAVTSSRTSTTAPTSPRELTARQATGSTSASPS